MLAVAKGTGLYWRIPHTDMDTNLNKRVIWPATGSNTVGTYSKARVSEGENIQGLLRVM